MFWLVKELQVADLNQDLLLAVLAMLTGAVPREELRLALLAWAQTPGTPAGRVAERAGATSTRTGRRRLNCLVSAHLRQNNGDLGASLDAWNAQALTQDMLTELETTVAGSSLGATLAASLAATLLGYAGDRAGFEVTLGAPQLHAGPAVRADPSPCQGGHRPGLAGPRSRAPARRRGQGDPAPRSWTGKAGARFLLEAEITGNLEHPGIVPVYSLGRNANGQPFYAMRFIRGSSLSTAIKEFHERRVKAGETGRERSGSVWGVEFQQLLRRFLDVCDAMEYAHSRGVIHRDLKPGNIMLGPYGETLVVDWGLAKVIGNSDIVAIHTESGDAADFDPAAGRRDGERRRGDPAGHHDRDPLLHEPRAGPRGDRGARAGQRRVQPGGHPVRAAHRDDALPRQARARDHRPGEEGQARAAADRAPLDPSAAGGHLPEGDGLRAGSSATNPPASWRTTSSTGSPTSPWPPTPKNGSSAWPGGFAGIGPGPTRRRRPSSGSPWWRRSPSSW